MRLPPREPLAEWIARQRWFAGSHCPSESLQVKAVGAVEQAELTVVVYVAELTATDAPERYLLPLGYVHGRSESRDPIRSGDAEWFDALSHATSARLALDLLMGSAGPVRARWLDERPMEPLTPCLVSTEQSNSSVTAGTQIVKVYRRLHTGAHPEIEMGVALRRSTEVAPLLGWSEIELPDGAAAAVVVHRRVTGEDGFALATADVGRYAEGRPEEAFPGAAYELGIALGSVHADLAAVFGEQHSSGFGAELAARLRRRMDALTDVAVLAPYLPAAGAIFDDLARRALPSTLQRVHGDLHLGQTIFTPQGWRIIDFEGEPRRPLAERRAFDSPLRDVAGLLRSFDYAARWERGGAAGERWSARAREMLMEGYRLQRPDAVDQYVLDALVLDKALYEVGYETTYRPDRVRIPLAAVAALCGSA